MREKAGTAAGMLGVSANGVSVPMSVHMSHNWTRISVLVGAEI